MAWCRPESGKSATIAPSSMRSVQVDVEQRCRRAISDELLHDVLCGHYWRRAWTLQEVAVASRIKLLYGNRGVIWSQLERLNERPLLPDEIPIMTRIRQQISVAGWNRPRKLVRFRTQKGQSLVTVLGLSRGSWLTDRRDAVYASLGVGSDAAELVPSPDYRIQVTEVFIRPAYKYSVVKKSINIICFAGNLAVDRVKQGGGLPSWVPE